MTKARTGVYGVSRSVWDHHAFRGQQFSDREAWLWMLSEAAWKPCRVRVSRHVVDLKRGQLAYSTRFMASKFKWSEARVRRFLSVLKTDAMVSTEIDAGPTRITICNYDKFQVVGLPTDAPTDALTDAEPTQNRRKEEYLKTLRQEEKESRGAKAPDDEVYSFVGNTIRLKAKDFDKWKNAYPRIDMLAELQAADDYYTTEDPITDGKWFFRVSSWLKRANDKATDPEAEDPAWAGVL